MKKISLSYILAIVTIVFFHTNSICMEKHPKKYMLNIQTKPMSFIEKKLFVREIEKCGIMHIQNEIRQSSALMIEDVFYKTDKNRCQLTEYIFNKIEKKEQQTPFSLLNNYISNETCYWWIDDNIGQNFAVGIKAQLTNTKELENIIKIYKNNMRIYKSYEDNDTDGPNFHTCFKFVSIVCLIYYLYNVVQ